MALEEKPIICVSSSIKTLIIGNLFMIVGMPLIFLIVGIPLLFIIKFSLPIILFVTELGNQRLFKQYELYNDKFIVKYPLSVFHKTIGYKNNNIKSILIQTPKGKGVAPLLKIKWEENEKIRKRNHWFNMKYDDIQSLIDEFRNLNIEIEVDDINGNLH